MSAPPTKPEPISGIDAKPPYIGGRASVPNLAADVRDVYKLSANENALGASPAALRALEQGFDAARYPDGTASALRAALSAKHNIAAAQIVCGTGSGDLLLLLAHGFLREGDDFIHSAHGFLLFGLAGSATGARAIAVPEKDLTIDVDAMLAAVTDKTRLMFIANPNNPTGTMLGAEALAQLHAGLRPDILLVIDEAYSEFADAPTPASAPDMRAFDLVAAHANVVVTRTFSKAYGLAALRLGWCYAPAAIADVLNRLRGPFNITSAALLAGAAAVGDDAHIMATRAHNTKWRDWLVQQIAAINGVTTRASCANFIVLIFADAASADAAETFMAQRGVIVRGLGVYGLAHALRLTVGTEDANRAALAALEQSQQQKSGGKHER